MRVTVTCVYVKTTFVGFHRWKNAPDQVAFLRNWHRHVFHVRMGVKVGGHDREVEFFQLKALVEGFIHTRWTDRYFEASCEMIANELLQKFDAEFCDVSEDLENGAFVVAASTSEQSLIDALKETPHGK